MTCDISREKDGDVDLTFSSSVGDLSISISKEGRLSFAYVKRNGEAMSGWRDVPKEWHEILLPLVRESS